MAIDMPKKKKAPTWTTKRIKALRLRLGLTQTKAAEKVEATLRSWQYWEAGTQIPNRCHLRLIELLDQGKL